jgi:two-component system, LytTR family, response regulator
MISNCTKCLIVDDEQPAIDLIKSHLKKFPSFEVAGECRNAFQVLEILRSEEIDLIFLDINLPGISGLDFLRSLPSHPYIIIASAHTEYALEGYDHDIVDFLVKPIMFGRFMKAISRYCERTRRYPTDNLNKLNAGTEKNFILIQEGKDSFKVFLCDILYLEAYGEYVRFYTEERKYLTRRSLSDFESDLPKDIFMRIHKSYLVNIQKVTGFSTIYVILKTTQLPIGRNYRPIVLGILKTEA